MYRIAKLQDLPTDNFKIGDQALLVDAGLQAITPTTVDKEHRSVAYLSAAIGVINNAYDRLTSFDNIITSTYLTTELTDTYLTANTLIHETDVTNVITLGSNGAFLSKTAAATMQTECIKLIQQLKEKAMNMFTANLDDVFKKQQSMNAVPFGVNYTDDNTLEITGTSILGPNLTDDKERYDSSDPSPYKYDFLNGQFSLNHLLTGFDNLKADVDFWTEFKDNLGSFQNIDDIKAAIAALSDDPETSYGFCNATSGTDGAIVVPMNSVDTTDTTVPVATIVFEILKRQIYIVIKNIYMQYLLKLTRYPKPADNS